MPECAFTGPYTALLAVLGTGDQYATEVSSFGQRKPVRLSGMWEPYVITFLFTTPTHSRLHNIMLCGNQSAHDIKEFCSVSMDG